MAFCRSCGAQLKEGAAFCGSCGAPVSPGTAGPVAPPPSSQVPPPPATATASGTAMSSNVAGLLTYILGAVTGVIFLLIEPYKNDRFVRFHAFQSILYWVTASVIWWAISLLVSLLSVPLGLLSLVALPIYWIVGLVFFVYWLILLFRAYSGKMYMIPSLGPAAARMADPTAPSSNTTGFLAYVLWFITGIMYLMTEPYKRDPFVRFHALQSIFFSVAYVALSIVWVIFSGVFIVASFGMLWRLVLLVWIVIRAAFLLLWVLLMKKAYAGERYMLPVIGEIAAKQAG